jgi:predicted nucleic acid-binding Zn ribbon protein
MKPPKRHRPLEPTRSGPGADGRDPALLGDQVSQLFAERGWQADLAVGSVTGRWAQIVGPEIAEHVRPVTFEDAVLTVQADSTAWATQIRLLSAQLLGRIAQEAGPGTVGELVVLGPAAPRWQRGSRRVAGRGPRDTYG